jgi:hypothetical protein
MPRVPLESVGAARNAEQRPVDGGRLGPGGGSRYHGSHHPHCPHQRDPAHRNVVAEVGPARQSAEL